MKDCQGCGNLSRFAFMSCMKKHNLYFSDGCKKCGTPYNDKVFWLNLMYDKDDECPDYEDAPEYDPFGS